MNKKVYASGTRVYSRIPKNVARIMWGYSTICLCPIHLDPTRAWSACEYMPYQVVGEDLDFNKVVHEYLDEHCNNQRNGYTVAFYHVGEEESD